MSDERTIKTNDYEGVPVEAGGKRCGIQWDPWMGDWFTSWSPRNSNSNAEGPWDHWVDLALAILRHPFTAQVRPQAAAAVAGVEPLNLYDEASRYLTAAELLDHFGDEYAEGQPPPEQAAP